MATLEQLRRRNRQLLAELRATKQQVLDLEEELDESLILRVDLPTASKISNLFTRYRAVLVQIAAGTYRGERRKSAVTAWAGPSEGWYCGWLLAQAIYMCGTGHVWEGLASFMAASEALRNRDGPHPADRLAVERFVTEIREELN